MMSKLIRVWVLMSIQIARVRDCTSLTRSDYPMSRNSVHSTFRAATQRSQ